MFESKILLFKSALDPKIKSSQNYCKAQAPAGLSCISTFAPPPPPPPSPPPGKVSSQVLAQQPEALAALSGR